MLLPRKLLAFVGLLAVFLAISATTIVHLSGRGRTNASESGDSSDTLDEDEDTATLPRALSATLIVPPDPSGPQPLSAPEFPPGRVVASQLFRPPIA